MDTHPILAQLGSNFCSLLQSSGEAIFCVDLEQKIIQANPAACTLVKHSAAYCIGKNLDKLCEEAKLPTPTTETDKKKLSWQSHPLTNEQGQTIGHYFIATKPSKPAKPLQQALTQTISEKMQAEMAFEDLIALLPGHVYWYDTNSTFLGCNDLQAKSFGLASREAIIGTTPFEYKPEKEAQDIVDLNNRIVASGKGITKEETGTYSNQKRIFLSQKEPMRDGHGNIIGILGISFDITERKQLESELKVAKSRAESTLTNVISLLPGHVYWKDRDGMFLGCNEQQAKSAGFDSPEQLIGKTASELPWADAAEEIQKNDQIVMDSGETQTMEESGVDLDGNERIYLSQKAPLRNENNEIVGIVGVSFDITERKQATRELSIAKEKAETANQAKAKFIANISHDLRTPLHSLLGMAEMLKIRKHYPEQNDLIKSIMQSGKNVLTLIEDILYFSKLEADRIELKHRNFDLKELIQSLLSTFSLQAKQNDIELIINYPDETPSALASDPDIVRRILLNLLTNAIKFTKTGHILVSVETIDVTDTHANLQISVEDTGIGIEQNDLEHIFDRFYRVNPSYQGQYKGTGLGLSIAKQLVDRLHGQIRVNSRSGFGSTFYCSLSFELNNERQSANESYLLNKQYQVNVLLVEDDKLAQKVSSSILAELGCSVDTASDGAEALEKSKGSYDVIFMDIGLPDIDGLSVTEKIRARESDRHVPIYALTAHASEEDQKTCEQVGMDGFVVKPASYNDFQKILEAIDN